jgi:hypothetical protein
MIRSMTLAESWLFVGHLLAWDGAVRRAAPSCAGAPSRGLSQDRSLPTSVELLGHLRVSVLPLVPTVIPYRPTPAEWSRLFVVRSRDFADMNVGWLSMAHL